MYLMLISKSFINILYKTMDVNHVIGKVDDHKYTGEGKVLSNVLTRVA
jgi:hypothetical protein